MPPTIISRDETLPVPDVVRSMRSLSATLITIWIRLDILPERKSERGGFSPAIIILSMGIVGYFGGNEFCRQSLRKVRTTVANVDGILKAEEQQHGEKPAELFWQ